MDRKQLLRWWMSIVLIATLAGAPLALAQDGALPDRIDVAREGFFPEGIEYDAAGGRFLLGSLQSNPYYLMQPRDGGLIEGVIGDPYWRQIYATATIASFRAMLYAAHIGTVLLVETADEADLERVSPFPQGGETTALEILWFTYNVHLRSHVEDLRKWVQA